MSEPRDWRPDVTQTHKPTWNSLTTSLLLQLWRTEIKRRVKSCNFKKESKNKSGTEVLLGIYLTKLNEEERKSRDLAVPGWARGRRPLRSLAVLLQGQSLSMLFGHIWIFLTVFWPLHSTTPPSPPSLSHGALVSTDQAFNLVMIEDSLLSYAYGTECKKKR